MRVAGAREAGAREGGVGSVSSLRSISPGTEGDGSSLATHLGQTQSGFPPTPLAIMVTLTTVSADYMQGRVPVRLQLCMVGDPLQEANLVL